MAERNTDIILIEKDGVVTDVVRSAFERVWKDKGWSEASQEDAEGTRAANRTRSAPPRRTPEAPRSESKKDSSDNEK